MRQDAPIRFYELLLLQQPWPIKASTPLEPRISMPKYLTPRSSFVRQRLHGLDIFVQHIPLMLNWIEIWGIWRPSQHQSLCFAHQTTPKPFLLCVRAHWRAERGKRPLEHCCHQRVYVCNNATYHLVIPAWISGLEVFKQIMAQRFTLFLTLTWPSLALWAVNRGSAQISWLLRYCAATSATNCDVLTIWTHL